jgi:hypothetical protein
LRLAALNDFRNLVEAALLFTFAIVPLARLEARSTEIA